MDVCWQQICFQPYHKVVNQCRDASTCLKERLEYFSWEWNLILYTQSIQNFQVLLIFLTVMPTRKFDAESPSDEHISTVHHDRAAAKHTGFDYTGQRKSLSTATLLRNPLTGMTQEEVLRDVDAFVREKGLEEYRDDFRKGAIIAQVSNVPGGFEDIGRLNESEKEALRRESTHRWSQPFMLYFLCTLCAGSAIVQGMDQTAVNGAQVIHYSTF